MHTYNQTHDLFILEWINAFQHAVKQQIQISYKLCKIGTSSLCCSALEQFAMRGDELHATGQPNSYYKVLLKLTLL